MKKNALGFIALAMMLMGNVAMAATQDGIGAIRSIDRCNEYGVVYTSPGSIEDALTVGDKAYFRIRLENHNSQAIYRSWTQTHTNRTNPWYFWDDISGLQTDPVTAGIKVGVFVSGRFTLADVIDVIEDIRTINPSDGGGPWFTDLLCSYTVQPGDLALPMTLANSNRDEATASDTTAYFVGKGSTLLTAYSTVQLRSQIHDEGGNWDDIKNTMVCSFKFGNYWEETDVSLSEGQLVSSAQSFAKTSDGRDYTLFNSGIFIQSIDFDKNTEKDGDETYWRVVHERSTSTKEFVPSLFIPGTVPDDYYGSVYLWSADETSVMLPDATLSVNGKMVQKLNIDGTPGSLQFRLRGVTQGTTTEIFLSSTLTNVVSGSGRTITNFVSRTVACIAPLEPMVTVLANNSPTLQLNATQDYTNTIPFKVELTQVWPNNEPVTVKFRYYLTNATEAVSGADLTKMALIAISEDQQFGYDSILPDSVTIPAGGTDSIELSTNVRALYALGALTGSNKGDKIVIEPYIENAAMAAFFTMKPLTLTIYGMKPNILTVNGFAPAEIAIGEAASPLSVRGGVTSEFEVRVSDTYRNMVALDGTNGYFTVTWKYGGVTTVITNDVNGEALIPDGDGILHVPMAYPVPTSDQNMFTTIKVMNADGRSSELSFYVFVKQPKNVTAAIGSAVVGEGVNVPVTFTLNETSTSPSLYAYLEPANEAASNLSYAAFFTTNGVEVTARGAGGQGIPFVSGELTAVSDALIAGNGLRFYDNSTDFFVYNIRLSSSPTWNPSMHLSEFVENQLVVTVTNNVPVINLVSGRNASNQDEDMSGTVQMSVGETPRVLRVTDVADVDADLKGTDEKQIVYRWAVYKYNANAGSYPDRPTEVIYTIGLGSTISITNFFKTSQLAKKHCGLYKFSVRAQDKDMRAGQPAFFWEEGGEWIYSPEREVDGYARKDARLDLNKDPNSWGDPYEFQLRIDENPYVFLNAFGNRRSESQTGYPIFSEEDMVGQADMGFVIALNAEPNISGFDEIPFKVTVMPEDGVNAAIDPVLSDMEFYFDATFYSNRFTFLDFDGTWMNSAKNRGGLYRIVAEVSDPTAASEDGTLWKDLYSPCTNYFRIENFKPKVIGDPRGEYAEHNSQTNAVLAGFHPAPGERFSFSWALEDVDSDIASNMVVTCIAGGQIVAVETNTTGSGVFSVWFDKQGSQKLQVYATDKDGDTGYSEWFYFEVQRSKNVSIYPFGPSHADVGGDEASKYGDQPGFGVGRVWADGVFNAIKDFMHEWTYGVEASYANLYAEGYGAWQMDTATSGDKSIAPKQDGNGVGEGDDRYVNKSDFDCFFYRWFKYEPGRGNGNNNGNGGSGSGSSDSTWSSDAPAPAKMRSTRLNLPVNMEGGTSYPDAAGLAVFSRERYIADNLGDINGDGIPDVFAARTWTSDAGESKRLYEIVSGGSEDSGGSSGGDSETSVNDLVDISAYNDDLDFLPAAASAVNPLKPIGSNWGPGVKFDALYEIRGIGVSEATDKEKAHLGLNEPGISDYDLSPAERYALFADYTAAGNALTGVADDDYAAATNWATAAQWTPEAWEAGAVGSAGRRLNPAKADTDDDGFEDGWEYFFWYYAKIGFVDANGVWGRLEGRRFDLTQPNFTKRISPEEIVAAFDPLVKGALGRDTDNDGLTDFEEYVLGTNPVDWDSDGDGMNDLWEVLNGLDPLYSGDAADNPDYDYMARSDYEEDTFTVFTFVNGDMFALPTATAPSVAVEPVLTETNVYEVVVDDGEDGEITYFAIAPAELDSDGAALGADTECFETVESEDGTVYLKSLATVTLPAGTMIVSAAADGEETSVAIFSGYSKAKVYLPGDTKPTTVWFSAAELPVLIPQTSTGQQMLAVDASGFLVCKIGDVEYLGESRVFPAGTIVASLATPVNVTQALPTGFSWTNPETLDVETTTKALPLFNYGGDGKTLVPRVKDATQYAVAPVVDDKDHKLVRTPIVNVEEKRTVTLIHNQVFNQYGFDPRTAWNIDRFGFVDVRWRSVDSESAGAKGDAGVPTNTVEYTSYDEFWVLQYRRQLREVDKDTSFLKETSPLHFSSDADLIVGTTYPNVPVLFAKERAAQMNKASPFDNSTNDTIVAYWDLDLIKFNVHGADTDRDGVPDGWELYVNSDPNDIWDGSIRSGWENDGDALCIAEEYAGVDSCNAYTNHYINGELVCPEVETITANHPGKNSGWWNKFFPTNPQESDTDGDGLSDSAEGAGWNADFYVGNHSYGSTAFTFIYGMEENAEKYEQNASSICFRGGGLNPCTVDTDSDLIPDGWEYQFAGIVFKDGATSVGLSSEDLITVTQRDGKQAVLPETGSVIRGGMDGTWSGDPDLDFDHDGLLNCQEYLVQSLRHLRYDDLLTPLMGLDPNTKKFVKFVKFSAWDGETFHTLCLESGFPGLGDWQFDWLGYFTRPPHAWDPLALNKTGQQRCANYEEPGYRVMLPPHTLVPVMFFVLDVQASGYLTTDPRRWDSDEDGMDDYYELFHGLNPLLGSSVNPAEDGEYGYPNSRFDVIASLYGMGPFLNSWCNYWTGWSSSQPAFDALRCPWMMGTMECDADGDGLRNDEEAIKVNVASPSNTHTDPTPLWMTDSSGRASYVAQYYAFDPYILEKATGSALDPVPDVLQFPWGELSWSLRIIHNSWAGATRDWMFAFEENEGFDTDHDFKRDTTELVRGVEDVSDPLLFADPDRRQALYLPGLDEASGVGSAAISRDGEFRRAVSTEPDMLKQFTVECWVKPDGAPVNAVILERVCNYGPSTLSNNTSVLRANFRLGVDGEGKVYGEFEGSTPDAGSARVTGVTLAADVWTHLAFTFDGSNARLYVNDEIAPIASQSGVGLIPANGVDGIRQEFNENAMPYDGYRALPCATVLGARLVGAASLSLSDSASWDDFTDYFKGWVDEVRIWDGARTATQLHDDVAKRYTFDEVKELRQTVYDSWRNGATRNNADGKPNLPAELLQHYNFVTLPGGVAADNVITEPTGFTRGVLDNVRKPNGESIDELLVAGWWYNTPVHSTVYWDYHVIPWIGNTVAHLPLMDGSVVDSQYWSLYAAGVMGSVYSEVGKFEFPNTANPYPYYIFRQDRYDHDQRLSGAPYLGYALEDDGTRALELARLYNFQLRSDFVGTSDLVPLGGAFARRGTDFWDGVGAMDAWTETRASVAGANDSDEDGIPDWAEALGYATAEAYLRALAAGLLPDGSTDDAYAALADANRDGVRDWWQRMYGLKGSAKSDTDQDGLADFAEYLISEVFKFGTVDPTKAMTNGKEFDYFRKAGKLYLGELFADHDFMEDWWENMFANGYVSSAVYDPSGDADGDGWSNYAECRAGTRPDRSASLELDDGTLPEYPIPLIRVKATCENAANISAPIVVQAYASSDMSYADATWTIPGANESMTQERLLGMNPDKKVSINLGPGVVVPGTVDVMFRDPNSLDVSVDGTAVWNDPMGTSWHQGLVEIFNKGDYSKATFNTGTSGGAVGDLDYNTGTVTIDFSQLQGYLYIGANSWGYYQPAPSNAYERLDLSKSYVKVLWSSRRIAGESQWEFSLSTATAGHVREGANTFMAFVDLDGNGAWSQGEPMGIVRNVNVGWSGASFEVEMTETSPICPRPALNYTVPDSEDSDNGSSTTGSASTNAASSHVYVYRYAVDEYKPPSSLVNRLILDKDIGDRSYLHEGDFLAKGVYDIDWAHFQNEVVLNPTVYGNEFPVTSVTYRVYSQPVNIAAEAQATSNITPYVEFTREFGATRATAVPVAPGNYATIFYGARPTFAWRMTGDRPDTYTAFAIQVKDEDGTVIWNSGTQAAPPRNEDGYYSWQAPLCVGDQTTSGKVFANLANYTWRVTMYNSKYQSASWSDDRAFRMNVYGADEADGADRHRINVAVKYFGPGTFNTSTSKTEGSIRVEAFTSPDFSGEPAGRTFIRNATSVTDGEHEVNATIIGLDPGTYYVRAYIDSTGNFIKNDWESWGYACPRGDADTGAIFAPISFEIGEGKETPTALVYIEDCDKDQDCLPDVWEYDTAGSDKADFLLKKGPMDNDYNGYISVNPNLQTAISDLINGGSSITLMSAGPSKMSKALAALMLGVDTVDPSLDAKTLSIKELTLANGEVTLSLSAEAEDPAAGTVFVTDGMVRATVVVKYAASLDGEWRSVEKTLEKKVEEGAVSEELTFSLEELGLDASKGFFKVELKQ